MATTQIEVKGFRPLKIAEFKISDAKDLVIHKSNIRKTLPDIEQEDQLSGTIGKFGVIKPILVVEPNKVIDGQRRVKKALQVASTLKNDSMRMLPTLILKNDRSDREWSKISLILDTTHAYAGMADKRDAWIDVFKEHTSNNTTDFSTAAEDIGLTPQYLRSLYRIMNIPLPNIQAIIEGRKEAKAEEAETESSGTIASDKQQSTIFGEGIIPGSKVTILDEDPFDTGHAPVAIRKQPGPEPLSDSTRRLNAIVRIANAAFKKADKKEFDLSDVENSPNLKRLSKETANLSTRALEEIAKDIKTASVDIWKVVEIRNKMEQEGKYSYIIKLPQDVDDKFKAKAKSEGLSIYEYIIKVLIEHAINL